MPIANEKGFDLELEEISKLYKHSKDLLHSIQFDRFLSEQKVNERLNQAFNNVQKLRDIACINLKHKYRVEEN